MKKDIDNNTALLFAQWIGEKQYSKHQVNDRWYDDGEYIGSTEDIFNIFSTENKK
jgi:hypothetical protein